MATSPQAWQAQQALLQQIAREARLPYQVDLPTGICDYALYRENGEVLAIVEAKRSPRPSFTCARSPRMGVLQFWGNVDIMALSVNPCVEDASRGLARSIVKLHRNRSRQTRPETEGRPQESPS